MTGQSPGPFDKEIDKQMVAITQNGESKPTEKTGRTGAFPYTGEGWYRNNLKIPELKKGQRSLLVFDGAMSEPKVYLNGKLVGQWNYGYNSFYLDVTDQALPGEMNTLAVHLSNRPKSSRWYPGAGLYRNVHLIIKDQQSIEQWGVSITTPLIEAKMAKLNIKTKVTGDKLRLETHILDQKGNELSVSSTEQRFGLEFEQNIGVENPQLWSPESPYLYTAISKVYEGNVLKDEVKTRFGIREIRYEADKGFSLNGKVRKFKGVCLHHDLVRLVQRSILRHCADN